MKRFPLLSLSLVVGLGVGCSNPAQESAPTPTQHSQVKKRTQALEGSVALREIPVSAAVLAAAEGNATVRAFSIESTPGEYTADEAMAAAFQQGVSDPANLPWHADVARSREETRTSLRYVEGLIPTIEAELGADADYTTGYYHFFRPQTEENCELGDAYEMLSGTTIYVLEFRGTTEC
ncbi:hypothetical protein [Hyalangium versicolor]|uniref:hypothetical protein n=1 Tax=Hyalangium versicolor TaxID=2861190 RepID=UPI001CCCFD04|nr:hypothetical protein [Hyalangium versicolor]